MALGTDKNTKLSREYVLYTQNMQKQDRFTTPKLIGYLKKKVLLYYMLYLSEMVRVLVEYNYNSCYSTR